MSDINIAFSRSLLSLVNKDLKQHFPAINPRKDAWVWKAGRQWEFHGPERFYDTFRADNAYEARAKGWAAWMRSKGIE